MAQLRRARTEAREDLTTVDAIHVARAVRGVHFEPADELAARLEFPSVQAMVTWQRGYQATRRDRARVADAVAESYGDRPCVQPGGKQLGAGGFSDGGAVQRKHLAALYGFASAEEMLAWLDEERSPGTCDPSVHPRRNRA